MESNLRRDDEGDEIHGKDATTASSALSSWKPRKLPASAHLLSFGGDDEQIALRVTTRKHNNEKDRVQGNTGGVGTTAAMKSAVKMLRPRCGFYTAEELLEDIKEAHWYRLSHPEDPHPYQDEIDAMRAIKKNIRPSPLPPCTSVVTFNGVRMNSSFEKRASVIFCDEKPTARDSTMKKRRKRSWMMDTLLPGISPSVDQ
ncbi:unnamed protein product [Arabidopsis lyrata]|nr:unnamed protein product [Arabidopsis lyrata]